MGWTARARSSKNPKSFDSHGDYRRGMFTDFDPFEKKYQPSKDTEIRLKVQQEISNRCKNGEDLDTIISEIAQREEIKENFSYWTKNGLDIAKMLKGLYESYKTNKEKNKDEGREQ